MSSFLTEQIDLSMCSTQTGLPLTANVYTLEGVTAADGSPRLMSIGQLVMAICLQRAAALERDIVDLMDAINQNTALINGLTTAESELVKVDVGGTFNANGTFTYDGNRITYYDFLTNKAGITGLPARSSDGKWNFDQVQTVISVLEDKMDSLNTISQDTLINLQSLTAKRDQTYDLVSNALKSFNTVLVGNANNI